MSLETVDALVFEVRRCFGRLKPLDDQKNKNFGIMSAMRRVIEILHQGGGQTVAQVARTQSVTRQTIQALVNGLAGASLVLMQRDPKDRRIVNIELTGHGKAVFAEIRRREKFILAVLPTGLVRLEMRTTANTLSKQA